MKICKKSNQKLRFKFKEIVKLNNTKRKNNLSNKLIFDPKTGFVIDTDRVLLIEKENDYWLTLSILKENELDTKITNLVLKPIGNNKLLPLIYRYDVTQGDKELIKNNIEIPDLNIKTTITTINNKMMYNGGYDGSFIEIDGKCYQIDHIWVENNVLYYSLIEINCGGTTEGGGGGSDEGGSSNGNSNPVEGIDYYTYDDNGNITTNNGDGIDVTTSTIVNNGSNNANTNNNDPLGTNHDAVVTAPLEELAPEPKVDHIQFLNTITNRQEVKTKLIQYKAETLTIPTEQGVEYFYADDPNQLLIPEIETPGVGGIQFGTVYSDSAIRVHAHNYPGIEPVFSCEDVEKSVRYYIGKVKAGADDTETATSILITPNTIYALAVSNTQKATKFMGELNNTGSSDYIPKLRGRYEKNVRAKAKKDCNCIFPSSVYEQFLLQNLIKFLLEEDTGLTLYSATINADGTLTWAITLP